MIEIAKMTADTASRVAALEKVCFSDPWSQDSILKETENPLSLWLTAMDGDILAGYVGSQAVMGEADVMNIAVSPDYRRRGIAERLMRSLIAGLAEKKNYSLALEVRVSNHPAIALYEKLGFDQVGRRPNYYRNPKEDALIMKKEWEI